MRLFGQFLETVRKALKVLQTWPPRAPKWHYSARFGPDLPAKSTFGAVLKPLFRQFQAEVRTIPLPRTPLNSPSRVHGASMDGTMVASLGKGPLAASHREELLICPHPNITRWMGIGLLGLPLYGVMTFLSSLNPWPDPNTHYEAWARVVTTNGYVLKHLLLKRPRHHPRDLRHVRPRSLPNQKPGRTHGVVGHGHRRLRSGAVADDRWGLHLRLARRRGKRTWRARRRLRICLPASRLPCRSATIGVSVLLQFVGNVLLGVAVWRSGILPKWAGALWAFAPVLMYVFGLLYR